MATEEEQDDGSFSSFEDAGDANDTIEPKDEAPVENSTSQSNPTTTKAMNAKDPLRPRRKKARRACFACQRAHLTCGDERPCQRCIKRGLQDACHDGVRKKAKYLHDAPNEALVPGIGNSYHPLNQTRHASSLSGSNSSEPISGHQNFMPQAVAGPGYGVDARGPMPPPMQDLPQFGSQQSPMSPSMYVAPGHSTSMQNMAVIPHSSPTTQNPPQNPYIGMYDQNDTPFNVNLAGLNFDNHYGALELGMLGHMSSGVADTPPADNGPMGSGPQEFNGGTGYAQGQGNYIFNQDSMMDWQGPGARQGSSGNVFGQNEGSRQQQQQHIPHAYTIGSGGTPYTSPSSGSSPQQQGMPPGYEGSPMNAAFYANNSQPQQSTTRSQKPRHTKSAGQAQGGPVKRAGHASKIYETVMQPYPYTSAFHSLTAFLQKRFSTQKTLRIAKSLASIRPSFISCTKNLNRADLIFMEKCFQRTLWEYEDFINACGTPTIVCRRTGEIAAVGKEFSILTNWRKGVLLGDEPNLNINVGGTSGASSRTGLTTPRMLEVPEEASRQQAVFLAELLDDDSVVEFYEDFAKLAFGDSRGSVTKRCRLLKYKTKDDPVIQSDSNGNPPEVDEGFVARQTMQKRGSLKASPRIEGEAGMVGLGAKDGKVECSYCWTVKRDVFDIPMLIVMNFLPCI